MIDNPQILVCASGGLDSTVLAYHLVEKFSRFNVGLAFADIGATTSFQSLETVTDIAKRLKVKLYVARINIPPEVKRRFPFMFDERASDEERVRRLSGGKDIYSSTDTFNLQYVPGRGTLMWVTIGSIAAVEGYDYMAIGSISGHRLRGSVKAPFNMDNHADFLKVLGYLNREMWGADGPEIIQPFRRHNKRYIVKLAKYYGIDMSSINSCDLYPPCGVCGECRLREWGEKGK